MSFLHAKYNELYELIICKYCVEHEFSYGNNKILELLDNHRCKIAFSHG